MEAVVDCQLEPRYLKLQGERVEERGKSSFFQTLYFWHWGWQSCVFTLRPEWNAGRLTRSVVLLPGLTHVWNHYFANAINEFVQPAAALWFYRHSVLQENVKRISRGGGKKKNQTDFPARKKLLHLNCTLTGLCSTQRNMNFCCTIFFTFKIIMYLSLLYLVPFLQL